METSGHVKAARNSAPETAGSRSRTQQVVSADCVKTSSTILC